MIFIDFADLNSFSSVSQQHLQMLVMMLGGPHVDVTLVLICMCLSQVPVSSDLFDKWTGENRTWVNPMNSSQCKSLQATHTSVFYFL